MKALGLVVSDKKNFESFIFKIYFLTQWPTYATNWNGLNNFDRGPPRDHSCEVWSKSNKRFQRRCRLKKLLTHARTHGRTTDAGHWRITKAHLSTSCSGELKINTTEAPTLSVWGRQLSGRTAGVQLPHHPHSWHQASLYRSACFLGMDSHNISQNGKWGQENKEHQYNLRKSPLREKVVYEYFDT